LKVGIYNEPVGHGVGGSETLVALVAESLARDHAVEIVHHVGGLTAGKIAAASGADLSRVTARFVERDYEPTPYRANPRERFRAARAWHAALSSPYDLFVATLHDIPPFCHAPRGALIVLFPTATAPHLLDLPEELRRKSSLRRGAERAYRRFEWRRRLAGYQVATSISDFTRRWTRRRWEVESEVVFPPVDTRFEVVPKERLILSVGRFALRGEGHTKNQPEMLAAYHELEPGLPGWGYQTAGGLRDTDAHRAFFASLAERAALCRNARVLAELEREELRSLFERASIFWHAAGYGEDEASRPELAEHFGISTVEAMAAGCVPVVIRKGGQPEIVRHGVDGFLWDTLEELKGYTRTLAADDDLRARMSESARARSRLFGKEACVGRYSELLRPLLS
jgi:glycosyltransferase involved in cell wall biosynthesis